MAGSTTTTTTTQDTPKVHDVPTGDRASANYPGGEASPAAERQGEMSVDKDAKADVVGGVPSEDDDTSAADRDSETQEQNLADAKADGLRNAARETQAQPRETGQPERDNEVRSGSRK